MPKDCLLGAARRRTLICCLAPRSLPPVLLALALGRRVSRKSACKDRSSLGSISRFVSARQLNLVYDRDRLSRQTRRDQCDDRHGQQRRAKPKPFPGPTIGLSLLHFPLPFPLT